MNRVKQFIDQTLALMLEYPHVWGNFGEVELQVIRLLEIRCLAGDTKSHYDDAVIRAGSIHEEFIYYLNEAFPDNNSACLLSTLVKDDVSLFKLHLKKFHDGVIEVQDKIEREICYDF